MVTVREPAGHYPGGAQAARQSAGEQEQERHAQGQSEVHLPGGPLRTAHAPEPLPAKGSRQPSWLQQVTEHQCLITAACVEICAETLITHTQADLRLKKMRRPRMHICQRTEDGNAWQRASGT